MNHGTAASAASVTDMPECALSYGGTRTPRVPSTPSLRTPTKIVGFVPSPAAPACSARRTTITINFHWPYGADHDVKVRGSWNNWSLEDEVTLHRLPSGDFRGELVLPASSLPCEFKYIVDGVWSYDPHQPTVSSKYGAYSVTNNYVSL